MRAVLMAMVLLAGCASCERMERERREYRERCAKAECPGGLFPEIVGAGYKGYTPTCMCLPVRR